MKDLKSKYEMQTKFRLRLFEGVENIKGGSKYRTIFWPLGRVGIAFGSVKIKAF